MMYCLKLQTHPYLMTSRHPALIRALRREEQHIAEAVTDAFLKHHPDWVTRYGDRARSAGIEDARFHVQFLAAAIENNSAAAFRDYLQWTTRVLESRGIDRAFLRENLLQVREAAEAALSDEQRDVVARFFSLPDAHQPADEPTGQTDGPLALARRMFLQAALRGDRRVALTIVTEALRSGATIEDVYIEILQDGLYEVGRQWERNTITVAQEHMATAVTQFVMAQVFERIERPETSRGRVVLTGVPGELHHVGALMVADMLEARGWEVQFLGSNLPLPSVVTAVQDSKPDILGISVTMLFNLHHVVGLIAAVRALDRPPRVVVGGAAFRATDQWQTIGADGYAPDVKSALTLLCG